LSATRIKRFCIQVITWPSQTFDDRQQMLEQKAIPRFDFQPESVSGKAVLITGGTTGIGRATALLLAARGARVLIFGRHQTELRDALSDINSAGEVCGLVADQARHGDVRRVFREVDEKLGGLDILINNAVFITVWRSRNDVMSSPSRFARTCRATFRF